MDGKTLLRDLRQLLQEQAASTWMDDKTSYDYLYKAAIEFVSRTKILTGIQTITTVSGTSTYRLNADYLEMQIEDQQNIPVIKYNDGTNDTYIPLRDYDAVVVENQTGTSSVPGTFSVTDDQSTVGPLYHIALVTHPQENGEAQFVASDGGIQDFRIYVSEGDTVSNLTQQSSGIVVGNITHSSFMAALFDGNENGFVLGDEVYIYTQGRFSIVLDPAPSTSGHTITVRYVKKPGPVYSPVRYYKIPIDYKQALLYYAAWMYKNRDREPNYAELELKYFEEQVKKACVQYGRSLHRKGFRVNYRKRANEDSSWR